MGYFKEEYYEARKSFNNKKIKLDMLNTSNEDAESVSRELIHISDHIYALFQEDVQNKELDALRITIKNHGKPNHKVQFEEFVKKYKDGELLNEDYDFYEHMLSVYRSLMFEIIR